MGYLNFIAWSQPHLEVVERKAEDYGLPKNPPANARDMILGFSLWVGKIAWRREQLTISVFLLGKSHGQRSLAGYSPWGCRVKYD